LALASAMAAATTLFAAAHVRLVNEGSSGPLYECAAPKCVPAQTDDPSRKNLCWMDFYVLPDGCVSLASAMLRPDRQGIDVECGRPGATRRYRCETGSCRPLDPTAGNDGATARPIPLPADCGGRIHELIVIGAGIDAPAVFIECDASSGPAGEM
jgi:hypothetical protein